MENLIRVTLVSQNIKAISDVKKSIKRNPDILLNRIYFDFPEFVKGLKLNKEKIGILIIDLPLNEISGMEALSQLNYDFLSLRKIVITQDEISKIAIAAIRNGAKSILHYSKIKTELNEAIFEVFNKGVYFEQSIMFLMLEELQRNERKRDHSRLIRKSRNSI